jgi:hypothetical protein
MEGDRDREPGEEEVRRQSADNEHSLVNLHVEFFIRESGGTIVSRYEDLPSSLQRLRSPFSRRFRRVRSSRGEPASTPGRRRG